MKKELDEKWTEALIEAAIGPNLRCITLADKEGATRVLAYTSALKGHITEQYRALADQGAIDYEAFTKTATATVLTSFSKFLKDRMTYTLENGMPEPSKIVKIH